MGFHFGDSEKSKFSIYHPFLLSFVETLWGQSLCWREEQSLFVQTLERKCLQMMSTVRGGAKKLVSKISSKVERIQLFSSLSFRLILHIWSRCLVCIMMLSGRVLAHSGDSGNVWNQFKARAYIETIQDKRFQDYLETIITVAMFQGEDREEHGSTGRELGKTVSMICSQKQVPKCPVSEAEKSISSEHPKDALNTGRKWAPLNFELCVFLLCCSLFGFHQVFQLLLEVPSFIWGPLRKTCETWALWTSSESVYSQDVSCLWNFMRPCHCLMSSHIYSIFEFFGIFVHIFSFSMQWF